MPRDLVGREAFGMKNIILMFACLFIACGTTVAATPPPLAVSDRGLGAISGATRFNQAEIRKLLTGYVIKLDKRSTEGEAYPVFLVMDQQALLATINPTEDRKKIFSIRITNNQVRNELGAKIGTKYGSIYARAVDKNCSGGAEEMHGAVICPAPKSAHVFYVFRAQQNVPDGSIPHISILKDFELSEIVWRP